MMLRTIKSILVVFALAFFMQSCEDKLNLQPEDSRLTGDAAFENPEAYKQFLAKIYAGISLSGQQGPAGFPDLAGLDEGFSNLSFNVYLDFGDNVIMYVLNLG